MANPYLDMQVRTASPVALLAQLYDAALRHVEAARRHHEAGRVRERGEAISRALAIVGELRSSLDFERGADLAPRLEELYVYASERLFEANQRNAVVELAAAASVLGPLRDAWHELAERPVAELGG
ncbi:MAG: flagellar export chaperone FliS [Deltaproteobacteria bacterium]|nr:flagellar export chaperone FliS [Deltaproteobacteria bacterium]